MEYLNESVNMLMLEFDEKLGTRASFVRNEFQTIRAGRVSPAIVEKITVDYFGTSTPLRNLATITSADSRTIVINLWDQAILREVCKVLTLSNVGANPIDDGRVIRLIFPMLTEERRKELVKQVRKICEDGKIAMRNDRRSALDSLKKIAKEENLSEDEVAGIEKDVQKILDNYVSSLDKLLINKESEIMEV